jgi:hypothetical protein
MKSRRRFSWAMVLVPVVLSAVGTAQAADTVLQTQRSCPSALLSLEDGEFDFGSTVAVSGQTALVGIPGFDTAFISPPVDPPYVVGRVGVFTCEASTQTWTRTANIQLPATEANQSITFGISVALQGNLAAIGAQPGVYLYKRKGQNWNPIAKISPDNSQAGGAIERWGDVIALNDDVLAVRVIQFISTPGPGGIGSIQSSRSLVDLYQIITLGDRGAAIRIARLKAPDEDPASDFGASLAFGGDTLLVGNPPTTTAYLYERHGFRFILNQKLTGAEATPDTGFGSAVAISKDVILIGAPGENGVLINNDAFSSGAVYVFRHTSGPESPWVETQHLDLGPSPASDSGSDFGGSLAVNRKGQVVIGTPAPDDVFDQEYGPTYLYTVQAGQLVPATARGSAPATSLGMTDEYLIVGSVGNTGAGGTFSGVSIENLQDFPTN